MSRTAQKTFHRFFVISPLPHGLTPKVRDTSLLHSARKGPADGKEASQQLLGSLDAERVSGQVRRDSSDSPFIRLAWTDPLK